MVISPKLDSFVKKDGTANVFIYLYDPNTRQRAEISTDYYVKPKDWVGSEVDKRRPHSGFINAKLNGLLIDLEEYCLKNQNATPAQVKQWHEGPKGSDPVSYFQEYIKACEAGDILKKTTRTKLSPGYIKTIKLNSIYITEFSKKHRVTFESINEAFYDKFVSFMRSELNLRHNTIAKSIKIFKTICAHAHKKGIHSNVGYKDYVVTTQKVQKIRLTPDEVDRIMNVDLSGWPHLEKERERFAVAYNLLLRFGDSVSITEKNITMKGGKPHLSTFTNKNSKEILLPIKADVYKILKKNNFQIRAANSKSNKNLKKIGLLAGINEPVTITEFINGKKKETVYKKYQLIETHTTRRSAARNLFDSGMAPELIMTLGGWSTMKQLLEYIDIDLEYAASKAAAHPFFS